MPYGEKGEGQTIEQNENDGPYAGGGRAVADGGAGAAGGEGDAQRDGWTGAADGAGLRDCRGGRTAGGILRRAAGATEKAPVGDDGRDRLRLRAAFGKSAVFRRGLSWRAANCRLLHRRGTFGQFDSGGKTPKICLNRKWTIARKLAK